MPLAESAGAVRQIVESGKALAAGASNCTLDQLRLFHAECPLSAVQLPYNMLQRDIEQDTVPWCREHNIAVTVYWPLMKGLLAGRLDKDAPLAERDSRRKYPMYQGDEWDKNQAFVAELRRIAAEAGRTVAQLVINWTIHQPRHHRGPVRRQAPLANRRNRRRHGLAPHARPGIGNRRRDHRPRPGRRQAPLPLTRRAAARGQRVLAHLIATSFVES